MRFDIMTLFPEAVDAMMQSSISCLPEKCLYSAALVRPTCCAMSFIEVAR